jgi:hypothetical protein
MARFKLEDGAYRITESESADLREFLLNKLKRSGKKTAKGKLSTAGLPKIFIDGIQKTFKDKGKNGLRFVNTAVLNTSSAGRVGQIRTNQNRYAGKLRTAFENLFNELVGDDNTFEMSGKVYDKEAFINEQVARALKENKDIDVALKEAQDFFPGKSTIGHTDSVYGKYAVESPHAKYPESEAQNFADQGKEYKGKKQRIEEAGMVTSAKQAADVEAGLTERVGDPTSGETRNRIMRGEPPELVKAQELAAKRSKFLKSIYGSNKTNKWNVISDVLNNPPETYKVDYVAKNDNGTNGTNGKNGNGLTVNGKNGKNGFLKSLENVKDYSGITKFGRNADQLANIGVNLSTGNYGGAAIGAATYGTSKALQDPKVQARVARQITQLVAERGAKSAAKFLPGLDVVLSGKESWDYLKRGRWDQAGIAALSGAIGWIPVVGDGASAALDLSNTGIDIARLQAPTGANKKKGQNRLTRFLKGLNT